MYLREREGGRERTWGEGAEGEVEADPPLSRELNWGVWSWFPGPQDHDLSQRQMLN